MAEARIKQADSEHENVELKYEAGKVFASLDGLITLFKLNAKRATLSKSEKGTLDRMVMVLEKYNADGRQAALLDEQQHFFYSGEKIIYVGGQLDTEVEFRLQPGEEYTVFDNRKGRIGDGPWFPCITLEEFPGPTQDKRPGFLITMFRKK